MSNVAQVMRNLNMADLEVGKVLRSVGTAVLSNFGPIGAAATAIINQFLPEDDKLKPDASGDEVARQYEKLSSEDQAKVQQQFYAYKGVQSEWEAKVAISQQESEVKINTEDELTDRQNGVRPKMAQSMVRMLWTITLIVLLLWAYSTVTGKPFSIDLELIAFFYTTPAAVILAYFRAETKGKQLLAAYKDGNSKVEAPVGFSNALMAFANRNKKSD